MKIRTIVASVICLVISGPVASADESATLIQLDKDWGSAEGPEAIAPLLSDDILTIGPEGLVGKAQMLEAAASDEAPAGPYIAGDFEVRFLSEDVAVMVHSAGDPDPHWSMHVWQKQDGKWQIAASATVPVEE